MENRSYKVLTIVALVVAVAALSLGFAFYTANLTISSSATVTASEENFSVKFSSSNTAVSTTGVTPTKDPTTITAGTATISNTATGSGSSRVTGTISGLSATFTAPGQSATYTFYVLNDGNYDAYLTNVTIGDTSCGASTTGGASSDIATAVCGNIKAYVTISAPTDQGKLDTTNNTKINSSTKTMTTTGTPVSKISKPSGTTLNYAIVQVELKYEGSDYADGGITATFGDVTLTYASVADAS